MIDLTKINSIDLDEMETKLESTFCTANQLESFRTQVFNDLQRFKWFDVLVLYEFFDEEKVAAIYSWGFKEPATTIDVIKGYVRKTFKSSKHWLMFRKINNLLTHNIPCKYSEYKYTEYKKDRAYYDNLSEERIIGWCRNISEKLKAFYVFYILQLNHNVQSAVKDGAGDEDVASQEILISFLEFYTKVYADFVKFKWFDLVERLNFFDDSVMEELDTMKLKDVAADVVNVKLAIGNPPPHLCIFLSLIERYKKPQLIAEAHEDYMAKLEEYKSIPADEFEKWCLDLFVRVGRCTDEYCQKL